MNGLSGDVKGTGHGISGNILSKKHVIGNTHILKMLNPGPRSLLETERGN